MNKYVILLFSVLLIISCNPANKYVKQADKLYNNEEWDSALSLYTLAIQHDPENVEALMKRADIYIKKQKNKWYKKAVQDLLTVTTLDDKHFEAWYELAYITYVRLNEWHKAIKYFNKTLELNPEHTNSYRYRAYCYKMIKKYEQSLIDYNKAIKFAPDDTSLYEDKAMVYYAMNDLDSVKTTYLSALSITPDNFELYINLGMLYFNMGKKAEASEYFEKAKEIGRSDPELLETIEELIKNITVDPYENIDDGYYYR